MRRQLLELHQLALLAVRAVERADRLRLEQHRAELAPARQLPDLLDQGAVESEHDVARGLGARRVLEGLEVDASAARAPGVLARLEPPRVRPPRGSPGASSVPRRSTSFQSRPGYRIDGRREDPRRDLEATALEARAHAAVEAQEVARRHEAAEEADAGDREREHAQQAATRGGLRACAAWLAARLHAPHARLVGLPHDARILDQPRQLRHQQRLGSVAEGLARPGMEVDQHQVGARDHALGGDVEDVQQPVGRQRPAADRVRGIDADRAAA